MSLMKVNLLAIVLLVIGLGSLVAVVAYSNYNVAPNSVPYANSNWQNQQIPPPQLNSLYPLQSAVNGPITLDQAEAVAQQFLLSLHNPNLAIAEIMEFQYNFYIQFYEKDTGLGAFEMLIWRRCVSIAFSGICGIRVFFILRRRKHSRLIIHFKSSINEV